MHQEEKFSTISCTQTKEFNFAAFCVWHRPIERFENYRLIIPNYWKACFLFDDPFFSHPAQWCALRSQRTYVNKCRCRRQARKKRMTSVERKNRNDRLIIVERRHKSFHHPWLLKWATRNATQTPTRLIKRKREKQIQLVQIHKCRQSHTDFTPFIN